MIEKEPVVVKNISDEPSAQDSQDGTIEPKSEDGAIVQEDQKVKKKDIIRDNGPRIVGAMKLIPDVFLFKSGLQDTGKAPFRSAAAVGFMASRGLLLTYGSKDRAKNPNQAESPYKDDTSFTVKLKHNFYKVTHPNQYPVEAGAARVKGLRSGLADTAPVSVCRARFTATFRPRAFAIIPIPLLSFWFAWIV